MFAVKSLESGIFSPGALVIGFTAPAKAGRGETPNVGSDALASSPVPRAPLFSYDSLSVVTAEWIDFSTGALVIGLMAPSVAGRGFTEKSPFSTAAGVSGNVPGRSEEPLFSSGTSFANSAVVDVGATPERIPAVSGVCVCLMIRSGVRTLFKLPEASFS